MPARSWKTTSRYMTHIMTPDEKDVPRIRESSQYPGILVRQPHS